MFRTLLVHLDKSNLESLTYGRRTTFQLYFVKDNCVPSKEIVGLYYEDLGCVCVNGSKTTDPIYSGNET